MAEPLDLGEDFTEEKEEVKRELKKVEPQENVKEIKKTLSKPVEEKESLEYSFKRLLNHLDVIEEDSARTRMVGRIIRNLMFLDNMNYYEVIGYVETAKVELQSALLDNENEDTS